MDIIVPEVRGISSYTIPDAHSLPEDPSDCVVLVNVEIGQPGLPGQDLYRIHFCTPKWLARTRCMYDTQFLCMRGFVVVGRFSWRLVDRAVTEIVSSCAAPSWAAVSSLMARHAIYEEEGGSLFWD